MSQNSKNEFQEIGIENYNLAKRIIQETNNEFEVVVSLRNTIQLKNEFDGDYIEFEIINPNKIEVLEIKNQNYQEYTLTNLEEVVEVYKEYSKRLSQKKDAIKEKYGHTRTATHC